MDRLEHLVTLARRTAEEHDRDPDALDVSASWRGVPDGEMAERLRAMQVDRLVVFPPTADLQALPEALGELHQALAAA